MAASPVIKHSVNALILANPGAALEVCGGLLAAGLGAVTIGKIVKALRVDGELSAEALREIELMDEQSPEAFFARPTLSVYNSLLISRMRKAPLPQVNWFRGLWDVRHRGVTFETDGMSGEQIEAHDWTDIATPMLDATTGELR
jgi:hypothetical protein